MDTVDTVEIRVHPRNFQRVICDAEERGAKVARGADGRYLIDELPVILDSTTLSPTAAGSSGPECGW
jgi:hypothetical protein